MTAASWARDRRVALICQASIALAIVGTFGTWRTIGAVSLNGVEGPHNGWLVIIFGLIALAGVGPLARGSWFGVVTVLGSAAVIVFTAVESLVDDDAVLGGGSGWGLWLTIAAGVLLGGTALLATIGRARPRSARI